MKRAEQIMWSKKVIDVELSGIPIWIDEIDADTLTARVHNIKNGAQSRHVPVSMLMEIE